jgi:uncharacterized RDD family membrane protein YckC
MKCPKCGYLGFETTDRCRNCQYDFSLTPFRTEAELTLQDDGPRTPEAPLDMDLAPRDTAASALDLDRLFGDAEPGEPAASVSRSESLPIAAREDSAEEDGPEIVASAPTLQARAIDRDAPTSSGIAMTLEDDAIDVVSEPQPGIPTTRSKALPFEDSPILPPAARPPLAVRRSTPEMPRQRPRVTRPVREVSLDFGSAKAEETTHKVSETVASLMESPSLVSRIGAGMIDSILLLGIDGAVIYLTLRVTGLQNTLDDLRVLPLVPFVGFLLILAFGYVAAFTVAGGQTIGKMALSLRVIGDDGRRIDAAGGMLRALGCMLVPVTLGLSYLPALLTSDHRALHDRLAGTRVVQE